MRRPRRPPYGSTNIELYRSIKYFLSVYDLAYKDIILYSLYYYNYNKV